MKREKCQELKDHVLVDGSSCQKCHSDCKACSIPEGSTSQTKNKYSNNYCTACSDPTAYLHNGMCQKSCPPEFIADDSLRICRSLSEESTKFSPITYLSNTTGIYSVTAQTRLAFIPLHYPCLVLFIPLFLVIRCSHVGKQSLRKNIEIFLMATSYLERIGLLSLMIKAFMSYHATMYAKSGFEDPYNASAGYLLGLGLGAMITIFLDLVWNFTFYK